MSMSVGDAEARKTRLCSRMCATCIFRPGNLMHLRPGRVRDMVREARQSGGYITCHETLPYAGTGVDPAICRGFKDRYSTQALQVMERLWGFTEVEPPDHIGGMHRAQPTNHEAAPAPAEPDPATPAPADPRTPAAMNAPTRDADGNVVAESSDRPHETAVGGRTTPGGD